jgi:cytochrome P450
LRIAIASAVSPTLSRYADVRRILLDYQTFSTTDGVFIPPSGLPKITPLEYDPLAHTALRALMDGPLNPRSVRALEPTIKEIAHLCIDDFAGHGFADLAVQLTEICPPSSSAAWLGSVKTKQWRFAGFRWRLSQALDTWTFREMAHVAFGRGLHTCTGQHLARAEMRITLKALLNRLPDIRMAGAVKETGLTGGMMMQVSSLPVVFTPEKR